MHWLRSILLLALVASALIGEDKVEPAPKGSDWPQFLGPKRDGTSPESIKPWQGKLKEVWRKEVGPGHSSPVIVKGKVYLHTHVGNKEVEALTCFDANSGKELWQTTYERAKFASKFGTGPQGTPTVAGGKVYTFGSTGVLGCFDAAKGDKLWLVDTWKDFNVTKDNKRWLVFGAACSPLIDGDNVVVNVGGEGASVVAFTRANGEVAWKSLDDRGSYASGVHFGKDNEIVFLTQDGLRGFAPKDGKKQWEYAFRDALLENSTTPVKANDLLIASSIMQGMTAVKLEDKDGKVVPKKVWSNSQVACYFSTPIPVGKHLYAVSGSLISQSSTLHCVDLETGKSLWSEAKVGRWHAAMLKTADNKLLLLSDRGRLALLEPNEKQYKELASADLVKGEQIWAHPALSHGKVYFRDDKNLICLQMPE